MAAKTIDDLTALAGSALATGDEISAWDVSATQEKKVTIEQVLAAAIRLAEASGGAITLTFAATGSGAGNSVTLKGSSAGSGNTNGGDLVFEPGAKAGSGTDGNTVIRKPGGTPGTQELQISYGDVSSGSVTYKNPTINGLHIFHVTSTGAIVVEVGGAFRGSISSNTGVSACSDQGIGFVNSVLNSTAGQDVAFSRGAAAIMQIRGATSSDPGTFSSVPLNATQLLANTNDWAPGTARRIRATSDAGYNITGLTAGVTGQEVFITNVGSFTLTFKHQSASSTAANRFLFSTGADIAVAADGKLALWYDATTQRWRDS